MDRIKVMLVDDNEAVVEALGSYLRQREDIELVATAEDGLAALDLLRTRDVDVILLDLVLPKLDGFGVLAELQRSGPMRRPHIIAITALIRDNFIQRAISLGVDYYMIKPFDPDNVYARILDVMKPEPVLSLTGSVHTPAPAPCSLDERIANIFLSMGIPAHIKGYHFLREAIKLVVDDHEMINAITKDLYPAVAVHFGTTASKVERAIRHAIDVAWTRGQMENINLMFGSRLYVRHDKPTNGEFIALIADRLTIEKSA